MPIGADMQFFMHGAAEVYSDTSAGVTTSGAPTEPLPKRQKRRGRPKLATTVAKQAAAAVEAKQHARVQCAFRSYFTASAEVEEEEPIPEGTGTVDPDSEDDE